MPMTPMPPEPSPTDSRAVFQGKAFATVAALSVFVAEANALEANVTALEAAAQDHADDAAAAQVAAEAAAAQSAFAAGVTQWVSGTTYAQGAQVWSPANYVTYRRIVAGAGTTDPSADVTNWTPIWASITLARDLGRARALTAVDGATALSGGKYKADTSAAAITVKTPSIANSVVGDRVEFINVGMSWAAPNAFVISQYESGVYIQGVAASLNIDLPLPSLALECTYQSATQAFWVLAS